MKFTIDKKELQTAVGTVTKACAVKTTVTVLQGIRLEVDGNKLSLTGYNLEIGIRSTVDVRDGEDGVIVILAKTMNDILKKLPKGWVTVASGDDNSVTITCARSEFTVCGINAVEYPNVPAVNEGTGFSLSQAAFKKMISKTAYACSTDDKKIVFMGCLFEIKNNMLNIVAMDGLRIALCREPLEYDNVKFIVPQKTLVELAQIMDGSDEKVEIIADVNQVSFILNGYTMISRLLNGDYLDYDKYLKKGKNREIVVDKEDITNALDRALLVTTEKVQLPLKCELTSDSLNFESTGTTKKFCEQLSAKYGSDKQIIGINAKFLLDAVKTIDGKKVKIVLTGSANEALLILPDGDEENQIELIMPMRLKDKAEKAV